MKLQCDIITYDKRKKAIRNNLTASFSVIPLRFERKTHALEGRCSIQLSYGTYLFTQSRPKPICVCKDSAFIPLRQKFYTFFCPNNKKEYKEKHSIPSETVLHDLRTCATYTCATRDLLLCCALYQLT